MPDSCTAEACRRRLIAILARPKPPRPTSASLVSSAAPHFWSHACIFARLNEQYLLLFAISAPLRDLCESFANSAIKSFSSISVHLRNLRPITFAPFASPSRTLRLKAFHQSAFICEICGQSLNVLTSNSVSSEMTPSTPHSASSRIFVSSLTVHTRTCFPAPWSACTSSCVTSL